MSRSYEAQEILKAVIEGNFTMKFHADQRSAERTITVAEIQNIARTVTAWKFQEEKQTHWFVGYRTEGKGGGFTAVLEDGVWIVTVFKRALKRHQREKKDV
jgi:hypothetical protein